MVHRRVPKIEQFGLNKNYTTGMGSGCGSFGRAVDTRDLRFESSNQQISITFNCIEMAKINKKRPEKAHLKKVITLYF